MWYFTWILGLGLAVTFGILNGIWHEFRLAEAERAGAVRANLSDAI